jgi:hypothetical protein
LEISTFINDMKFKQGINHSGIGTIDGYYVTFFPGRYGFTAIPYFTYLLTEPASEDLLFELNERFKDYHPIIKTEASILIVIIPVAFKKMKASTIDVIDQILRNVSGVLKDRNCSQPADCVFCDQPGYETYLYNGGVHRPGHLDCIAKELESYKPPSNPESVPTDNLFYLRSMLYSVLFALLFTFPSVLAAIYSPLFYVILLFLVPLGSALGYLIGKGEVRRQSSQLMRLTSYLAMFIIILWCWNFYAKVNSQPLFYYLFHFDNLIPFLFDIVVGSLFTTFGLLLAKRFVPVRKS